MLEYKFAVCVFKNADLQGRSAGFLTFLARRFPYTTSKGFSHRFNHDPIFINRIGNSGEDYSVANPVSTFSLFIKDIIFDVNFSQIIYS